MLSGLRHDPFLEGKLVKRIAERSKHRACSFGRMVEIVSMCM